MDLLINSKHSWGQTTLVLKIAVIVDSDAQLMFICMLSLQCVPEHYAFSFLILKSAHMYWSMHTLETQPMMMPLLQVTIDNLDEYRPHMLFLIRCARTQILCCMMLTMWSSPNFLSFLDYWHGHWLPVLPTPGFPPMAGWCLSAWHCGFSASSCLLFCYWVWIRSCLQCPGLWWWDTS